MAASSKLLMGNNAPALNPRSVAWAAITGAKAKQINRTTKDRFFAMTKMSFLVIVGHIPMGMGVVMNMHMHLVVADELAVPQG